MAVKLKDQAGSYIDFVIPGCTVRDKLPKMVKLEDLVARCPAVGPSNRLDAFPATQCRTCWMSVERVCN